MTSKLLCVDIINSDDICIESISFSNCGQYLAASYGNNIAIYEVRSCFLLTTLSDCNTDASFRSLLWIPWKKLHNYTLSDYRLFTVGLHGIITEWDLNLFKSKESCNSYGGAIFSGVVSPNSDLLVTCDDGCVRSFSIWDDYNAKDRLPCLEFKRVQVTHTKSILSICCLPDGRFFCGTSDSLILICELEKDNYVNIIKVSSKKEAKRVNKDSDGSNEDEELVGVEKNKKNKDGNVHIWCLAHVPKNILASGDSNGNVMLWDLETLTMIQLFSQHNSDVLSLVLLNKNTLFSAGLDSKVTMYTNNTASTPHYLNEPQLYLNNDLEDIEIYLKNKSRVGWSVNGFKYPVKGDIRTLSVSSVHEFVASAGNFGCISICRGERFLNHKKSKYKLIFPNIFPFNPIISMNAHKNIALVRYPYHCDMWYLPTTNTNNDTVGYDYDSYNGSNANIDIDLNKGMDRKNKIYKQNERFESEVPYKLSTIKMNCNKGKIKSCCLSPEGDIVAISNEQCLRILLVNLDDLKISQLKFEHPEINVTSMIFLSNTQLLLTHYKERNIVSVYNINDGSLKDLVYLNFQKHVVKVTVHNRNSINDEENNNMSVDNINSNGSNLDHSNRSNVIKNDNNGHNNTNGNNVNETSGFDNTNSNTTAKQDPTDLSYDGFGVFYCLDGAVFVADFSNESYFRLPDFESGTRISSVAFSSGFNHLIAFSTSFKYYLFDLNKKCMITYQDQIIHNINTKVVNPNSVICNSFWSSNIVIVHTSYNIFYFKLVEYPFNTRDQIDVHTPNTIKTNNKMKEIEETQNKEKEDYENKKEETKYKEEKGDKLKINNYSKDSTDSLGSFKTPNSNESTYYINSTNYNNSINYKDYNSLKSRNTYNEDVDVSMSTPKQTKQDMNCIEDMFLTQSNEHKKFSTPKHRKHNTTIAPRRLYQVPSIEHYVYDTKDMLNNNMRVDNTYSNSNEFSSYNEFRRFGRYNNVMNNIFDSRSGESRKYEENINSSQSGQSTQSKERIDEDNGNEIEENNKETKNKEKEKLLESEDRDRQKQEETKASEHEDNQDIVKHMKSNEKLSIKYNNIIKSKFIVHVDLLLREQKINIMAFKTSLRDEVMRQKRYVLDESGRLLDKKI